MPPLFELQVLDVVVTSAHTFVVAVVLPDVPVTVRSYVPSVVEEVVEAISVEVCAVVVVNESEVEDRLQVAGLVAFEGALVTEHASVTVPVNELPGVTVIVDELPDVAPGVIVMFPLLERVKLLLVGASQNPEHPVRNGAAATNNRAKSLIFIP